MSLADPESAGLISVAIGCGRLIRAESVRRCPITERDLDAAADFINLYPSAEALITLNRNKQNELEQINGPDSYLIVSSEEGPERVEKRLRTRGEIMQIHLPFTS